MIFAAMLAMCSPVEFMVDPSWPDSWRKPLYAAVEMWERDTGRNFIETDAGGIWFAPANTAKMFGDRVQGATLGGSTTPDKEFAIVWIDERLKPGKRLRLVITHELGHALGLGHNDSTMSLMDWKARGQELIRTDLEPVTRCLPALDVRGDLPNP